MNTNATYFMIILTMTIFIREMLSSLELHLYLNLNLISPTNLATRMIRR